MSTWKMSAFNSVPALGLHASKGRAALGFIDEFFCLVPTFARSWLTWVVPRVSQVPHLLTAADVGHRPIKSQTLRIANPV